MNVLKTYTHSLMNQKELEEEQRLIAVNQIRKSELKAKIKPLKNTNHSNP